MIFRVQPFGMSHSHFHPTLLQLDRNDGFKRGKLEAPSGIPSPSPDAVRGKHLPPKNGPTSIVLCSLLWSSNDPIWSNGRWWLGTHTAYYQRDAWSRYTLRSDSARSRWGRYAGRPRLLGSQDTDLQFLFQWIRFFTEKHLIGSNHWLLEWWFQLASKNKVLVHRIVFPSHRQFGGIPPFQTPCWHVLTFVFFRGAQTTNAVLKNLELSRKCQSQLSFTTSKLGKKYNHQSVWTSSDHAGCAEAEKKGQAPRWNSCQYLRALLTLKEHGSFIIFPLNEWRLPEMVVPPVIIHFNKMFPYKPNHPFWGTKWIQWNPRISEYLYLVLVSRVN